MPPAACFVLLLFARASLMKLLDGLHLNVSSIVSRKVMQPLLNMDFRQMELSLVLRPERVENAISKIDSYFSSKDANQKLKDLIFG